jgi:hypothetical protein
MPWIKGASGVCETRLIGQFRDIVREPLPEPSDPRFKKWLMRERFPWGLESRPAAPTGSTTVTHRERRPCRERVIAKKFASVLVPDAEIRPRFKSLANEAVLERMKKMTGGLWLGGTATLYETRIGFRPHGLDRALAVGDCCYEIPLAVISEVQIRFRFVMKGIDIVTQRGKLSIRCFGAERFAYAIREQRKAPQSALFHTPAAELSLAPPL